MKNFLFPLLLLAGGLLVSVPAAAQTPTDKQLQAIEKLMAPHRKKVTDILEADKSGRYQAYKADLDLVAKESDRARRAELVLKLDRDHLEFIRESYARAAINAAEMRREIARILGHDKFALGEFGDLQIDFVAALPPLPERFDAEFSCPMEASDNSESSQLGSFCIAQGENCSTDVQCLAEIDGGCRARTSLGGNFVVPEGTFTNITVVAQTDLSYEGWAFAVGSYSQINAKYGVRFRAPGLDKVMLTKEVFALAPLVWYSHIVGNADNFISQASFSGSFTEGVTITALAYLEGLALSVPALGFTVLYADTDNIDFIRLAGSN
jgi:hypothetical protein